jgi:outer membrane protein
MNYRLKLALSCILAVSATAPSFGADLLEVYKVAQQNDPLIREADANRKASKEAKPQAWAALLPQINGNASESHTDTDSRGNSLLGFDGTGNAIISPRGSSNTVRDSGTWGLSLTQTIFRWDQWETVKRADAQVAQAEATYRAAEQDLIVRVIARYFAVLYAKDIVDTNEAALNAYARLLEQQEKRFEVGLIAITDVQESRAQRDRASANLIDSKRTLATSHELLRELTGQDFETLAAPAEDMPLNAPIPADVGTWINGAMEQNLALISARLGAEIADKNVGIARAGHLPSITLQAGYSDTDADTTTTRGQPYDTTGRSVGPSVSLNLNVPIFSGGYTQSVVRQNVYAHRGALERVQRTTRETERSVRDNFLGVISNISRVQALKQALESSKTALQATQAGFEVGTRTTVDVLLSQNTLYTSQSDYYKSRYEYLQTRVLLEQAAGQLSQEDLAVINGYLSVQPAK